MLATDPFSRHPVLSFSSFDFLFFSWTPQSALPAPRPGPFHQTGNHIVSPSQNASYIEHDPSQKAHKGPVFDPSLFFYSPLHGVHFQTREETLSPRAAWGERVRLGTRPRAGLVRRKGKPNGSISMVSGWTQVHNGLRSVPAPKLGHCVVLRNFVDNGSQLPYANHFARLSSIPKVEHTR